MKSSFNRSDFVRKRRSTRSPKGTQAGAKRPSATQSRTYHTASALLPVEPRRSSHPGRERTARAGRSATRGQSYDIAFNVGRTAVHAPAISISLPELGPRWISAGLAVVMVFLMYTLWNNQAFTVAEITLNGAERLTAADMNTAIGMIGEPVFKAVPADISTALRSTYPELSKVRVRVGFPNHLRLDVVERTPVLVWELDGTTSLIDASGVAFLPRGDISGLIQVQANDAPPAVAGAADLPLYERPYVDPALVQAMTILAPYVPAGTPMIFDPTYGMGWQDSHGWFVYFGQNTQDIPEKLVVYQAIVKAFTQQGIQPTLVSVEYLDAPFYK